MRLIGQTNIDFLAKGRLAFCFSGVVIMVGLISLFIKGEAT